MKTVIKAQNICYSNYIDNISFTVGEGEILAISGPKKSGKSTLLSLASGLIVPDKGNMLINNKPAKDSFQNIGYFFNKKHFNECCPEMTNIPSNFCIEEQSPNLNYILINHLLDTYGLITYKAASASDENDNYCHELKLIRSLNSLPDIILFDDPFTMFDDCNNLRLAEMLKHVACRDKKTCIITTSNQDMITGIADRVLMVG